MNQLRSAPTRIPNTLNSLTELVRRSMLQWSHSGDDPTGNFKRSEMSSQMQALKTRLGTIADLDGAAELASWDQQTKKPPNGSQARADVLGTLASLRHEAFTDDQTARLLGSAAAGPDGGASPPDPDSDDARLIEVTRRRWEKSRRVPSELEAEIARASSEGQEAWVAARAASDFKGFAPYLERILELTRRYVDCHVGHDRFDSAYDVLIDDSEPGIR